MRLSVKKREMDFKSTKTLIVIPVFNEGRSIRCLVEEIRQLYPGIDLLVIDDGSTDNSTREAKAGGARTIRHVFNLGDGAARQTGFLYALRKGYDYLIHLDGDRQHSPREIPVVLTALQRGEADLVVGSRFLGKCNYRLHWLRKAGMWIFSRICSLIIKEKITDPTSGFRGMNRKAMGLYTGVYYPQHFPDADVIILSHFWGLKIKEVPVTMSATQSTALHRGGMILYYIYKMLLSSFVASLALSTKRRKHAA